MAYNIDLRKVRFPYISASKSIPKDKCLVCGSKEKLENHRKIIRGPYRKENVICLCKTHHVLIHVLMRRFKDTTSHLIDVYETT